jgi:hypothetical protein
MGFPAHESGNEVRNEFHGLESPCQCVIKSMNSECESHIPSANRRRMAAGGNCAAVMQGGEQPEAEVRSQTGLSRPVNSIRCVRRASLLATERSLPRQRRTTDGGEPVDAGACQRRYSWSGNVRKGSWMTIRDRRERRSSAGVRAPIVAMKPGNAGGAKGRRKVNAG